MPGKTILKGSSYKATPYTDVYMHARTTLYAHLYSFIPVRTQKHTNKTFAGEGGECWDVTGQHIQTAYVGMGAPKK